MPDRSDDVRFQGADGYIETYTGARVYLDDSDVSCFDPVDIAHSLSLQCRYTGHTTRHYSVAEHSILVRDLVTMFADPHTRKEELRILELQGLLHDASEAYLSDMAAPFKGKIPGYRDQEDRLQARIMTAFGLPVEHHPLIKQCDWVALFIEADALMPNSDYTKWTGWEEHEEKVRAAQALGVYVPKDEVNMRSMKHEFEAWLRYLTPRYEVYTHG